MKTRLLTAICMVALLAAGCLGPGLPGAPTTTKTSVQVPGRIAFVQGGDLWLWEGGRERRLTQGEKVGEPVFSADGRFVAFVKDGLYRVMGASGAGPWTVAEQVGPPGRVTWSPTDATLAVEMKDGVATVAVTEGGPQPPVLVAPGWRGPAWSPDGTRLALWRAAPGAEPGTGRTIIALVTREGGQPGVIMDAPSPHESACGPVSGAAHLRWSADGAWLAFMRPGQFADLSTDCNEVAVLPAAGGQPIPVGVEPSNPAWFTWSPAGAVLAYIDGADRFAWTHKALRAAPMVPAGTFPTLTPAGCVDRDPSWTADGSRLAVTRSREGEPADMFAPMAEQAISLVDPETGQGEPVKGSEGGFGPLPGPLGSLLWVESDQHRGSLHYTPRPGDPPVTVVKAMEPVSSYYGQRNWRAVFDWWLPHDRAAVQAPGPEAEFSWSEPPAWRWENPVPQGNPLGAVLFAGGQFVAVGGSGTVLTSPDGAAWTLRNWDGTAFLHDIAYGNGRYVAVGEHGGVLTSTDGVSWQMSAADTTNQLRGVAFGQGQFVAVDYMGGVHRSRDGREWTAGSVGAGARLFGLGFARGVFVAVGVGGSIFTSEDGAAWTVRPSGTEADLVAVAYGGGRFVAVGHDGVVVTSLDGRQWRAQAPKMAGRLLDVTYGGGRFIAAGIIDLDDGGASIFTSPDGLRWSQVPAGAAALLRGVAYGNGRFAAVGEKGAILTSADGSRWTLQTRGATANLRGMAYGQGRFIAVGEGGAILSGKPGGPWETRRVGTGARLSDVANGAGRFVAVGEKGTVLTSADGRGWEPAHSGTDQWLFGVAYGGGLFVAVGGQGTVLTSPDGATWTRRAGGTDAWLNAVTYGDGRFVAVAGVGVTAISSADGIDWTAHPADRKRGLYGVAYGNGLFVAAGTDGAILTSPDGAVWTQRAERQAVYFADVAYGGGRFTAVGNEGWVATSADGVRWDFYRPLTSHDLKAVTYGEGHLLVAGSGGTILSELGPTEPPARMAPTGRAEPPGRMMPLTSVVYATLVAKDGTVRTEPVPVRMDPSSTLYFRWSPDGRYLVYGREADLFLYDAQTRQSRNLTRTPDRWELMPSWSPDGQYLAFTSRPLEPREGKPKQPGVYPWDAMSGCFCGSPALIRRDGSVYRVLDQAETTHSPGWSGDGQTLAYDHRGAIRLAELESGRIRALGPAEVGLAVKYLGAPAWSPQRGELSFFYAADDRGWTRQELMAGKAARVRQGYAVTDLATGRTRVLYEYRAPFQPRPQALWSADGERLALPFTCELILCDPVGLVVVDRAGKRAEQVAKAFYQAAWEPGGRRLAYIRHDDQRVLEVLTPDGRGWRRQEIRLWRFIEGIAWRPPRPADQAIGSCVRFSTTEPCRTWKKRTESG